jgi:PAS domain-containing protein
VAPWLRLQPAKLAPFFAGANTQTRTAETQLFRHVFNASPIGIAVENLEGQPLFVNPAFCSFLVSLGSEKLSERAVG